MAPTILSTSVRRQMDHYILALAHDPAATRPDALVSLYWIGYTTELGSPTSGHVAYVWSGGPGITEPRALVLTDSPALVDGLGDRLRPGRFDLTDAWPGPTIATFSREVTEPYGFTWRVTAPTGATLEAHWGDLGEPVYSTGPTRDGTSAITTMLVSARGAAVEIDGRRVPGRPYIDPIWTPWFGADQTSCVIGLGETLFHEAQ